MKIIPFTSDPNQKMTITIPIDGKNKTFDLVCRYNTEEGFWWLDIIDHETRVSYISGLPILSGIYPSANLLEQYSYMRIGSIVIVKAGENNEGRPNENNLGKEFFVLWGDTIG